MAVSAWRQSAAMLDDCQKKRKARQQAKMPARSDPAPRVAIPPRVAMGIIAAVGL
jgi:hypothetical protein